MSRNGNIAAALIVAAGALCAAPAFAAEESGTVRMLMSLETDYTTIDHGKSKVTAGSLEGTVTIVSSTGAPFVVGAHSIASCVLFAKQSTQALDLQAVCAMDAGSGDGFNLMAKRSEGGIGEGASGTGRFELGEGTGAFAAVTGTCAYDPQYLPGNRVVATADCQWSNR